MTEYKETHLDLLAQVLRAVTTAAFAILALGLLTVTLLAAFGLLPWLTLPLTFGETTFAQAGIWVQVGLTVLVFALLAYLPANRQVLALQRSHRNFHLSMEDITRAYAACHAADRAGAFTMSSEFDAVRERISWMRAHPDLRALEPGVIEVAAQMSQLSRDIAQVYSDEKLTRARAFLRQRQEEIDDFAEQLGVARTTVDEIRRWSQQINVEDSVQAQQLTRLENDLLELLPDLGFDVEEELRPERVAAPDAEHNVVSIDKPREGEPAAAPRFRDAGPAASRKAAASRKPAPEPRQDAAKPAE